MAESASLDDTQGSVLSPIEEVDALLIEERTRLFLKMSNEAIKQNNMFLAAAYIKSGQAAAAHAPLTPACSKHIRDRQDHE